MILSCSSAYVTALLLLIFNGIFMMRLIGTELAAYLNPIFGLVLILGAVSAIVCIAVLWYKAFMRALNSNPKLTSFLEFQLLSSA